MPRVSVHTVADALPESLETLEAPGKRSGKVINISGEMLHAPVLLKM